MTAPARREVVREMVTQGLSERRPLTVAHMSAATLRYVARPDPDPGLRERIVALAHRHRRYGAGMIVLKTIFQLRWQPAALRIGQVIFDPNGEHANENAQDAGER